MTRLLVATLRLLRDGLTDPATTRRLAALEAENEEIRLHLSFLQAQMDELYIGEGVR